MSVQAAESWYDSLIASATDKSLARKVGRALRELLDRDADLMIRDASEQALTGALARHLVSRFQGWDVDVEYNRDDYDPKKANGVIVKPDIIVHRRGTSDNLLVIEAKKSNTRKSDDEDLTKLVGFRSPPLQYRHALFVKLTVGPGAPGVERADWVT
jgi:hypothetical protein